MSVSVGKSKKNIWISMPMPQKITAARGAGPVITGQAASLFAQDITPGYTKSAFCRTKARLKAIRCKKRP